MKTSCAVGMRVSLVPQHWLRPYETGIVVDQHLARRTVVGENGDGHKALEAGQ